MVTGPLAHAHRARDTGTPVPATTMTERITNRRPIRPLMPESSSRTQQFGPSHSTWRPNGNQRTMSVRTSPQYYPSDASWGPLPGAPRTAPQYSPSDASWGPLPGAPGLQPPKGPPNLHRGVSLPRPVPHLSNPHMVSPPMPGAPLPRHSDLPWVLFRQTNFF